MRLLFFFPAEDGIRDDLVTGVQTCALPIWARRSQLWRWIRPARGRVGRFWGTGSGCRTMQWTAGSSSAAWPLAGSEEIGRASGRERWEARGVAVAVKKKDDSDGVRSGGKRH